MFTEALKKIVDNFDGGIAATLMALDGVPVESYVRQNDRVDVNTVAAEFSFIMGQVRKAGESLAVGACDELSVKAERLLLVLRMVTPQYFIAVAMTPEGNYGKCRYLMRLASPALVSAL